MDFRFIDDEYVWNIPLASVNNAQFLQSWEWGVFQQTLGRPVHRIQIVEDETVMASMQLFEQALPFKKKYLYAPRGPVLMTDDPDTYETIVHQLNSGVRKLAVKSRAVFFFFELFFPLLHFLISFQ